MEKILLKNKNDLFTTIERFGPQWEEDIKLVVSDFPCILLACFAHDIEFGEVYRFECVSKSNFD